MELSFILKFSKNPRYNLKTAEGRNPLTQKPYSTNEISRRSRVVCSLHAMWVSVQNTGFAKIQPVM
jgi:hypothetical protein